MTGKESGLPSCGLNTNSSPTEVAIRQHLEKILISPQFANSPNLQNFLSFIVEKTLAGEAADIKGYTVATQVLGRKSDFDPNLDPIVRIQSGRLRRALEQYYQGQGKSAGVIIEVPKGSYVPVFHPIAKPESAGVVMDRVRQEPMLALPSGPSVAVMPLLNLTGDQEQEYFTDGLAEELTSELARYQDLRVIAFQSSRRWKGKEIDFREVGRDLGVRFLVQGSIRKDSRDIKIAIRLIETLNGRQLWGEQYRRELSANSLIALQEEIAQRVAAKTGSELGIILRTLSKESRKKPPESLETYEAFLRFYHHLTIMSPQSFAETLAVLEQAVNRDPDSGLAWSLLSFLFGQSHALQLAPLESPLERALAAARKGVALEPENQMAWTAIAHIHFFRNQRELFLVEAEAAMALNPNSPGHIGFLGWLLALYGEWERGLAILGRGIELNPHYPGWFHMGHYFNLYRQERFAEAYREAQKFQMPQFFWDPLLRAASLGRLGRGQEAARAASELLQTHPDFRSQARFLISCFVKQDYLVDAVIEGLRQAGLSL